MAKAMNCGTEALVVFAEKHDISLDLRTSGTAANWENQIASKNVSV
jgi:hypothetical protein